ncbi:PPA1309 family protein [Streptomyces sp. RFCAC02]|uniref:PPA1309 family protein n=1 Tax=Streptomyces sp. RFCAC02 TaxID=2499143 RepID=UPI0019D1AF3D|nr:PPA1309 family protein [Streptomyces sp. RFCAC02]
MPMDNTAPGETGSLPPTADPLTRAVLEIDDYAAGLGWDRPALLFALVDTARLRAEEPGLADRLDVADDPGATELTPVEQDELPPDVPLDEFLATIAWPDAVTGCALTLERLMLPPSAEAALPEGLSEDELTRWVAEHPERREVRMTVAVTRDGRRESALRLREKDTPTEVLTGAGLVPNLAEALAATFSDD